MCNIPERASTFFLPPASALLCLSLQKGSLATLEPSLKAQNIKQELYLFCTVFNSAEALRGQSRWYKLVCWLTDVQGQLHTTGGRTNLKEGRLITAGGSFTEHSPVGSAATGKNNSCSTVLVRGLHGDNKANCWDTPTPPVLPLPLSVFPSFFLTWQPCQRASVPQRSRGCHGYVAERLRVKTGASPVYPQLTILNHRLRCVSLSSNIKKLEPLFFSGSGMTRC